MATVLALVSAVLHAAWNLVAKVSTDRFAALWAQFAVAGALGATGLVVFGGPPADALPWAVLSGVVHVPYLWFLARAYESGDFSLSYPVARGGGAALAAIGGVVLLDDDLGVAAGSAIAVVVGGLFAMRGRGSAAGARDALVVAVMVGIYTTADARGVRLAGSFRYGLAGFVITAIMVSASGLMAGRRDRLVAAVRRDPTRLALAGAATVATYSMVLVAITRAPVGYVAALRESSVVLAAWIGWRHLGEPAGRRRVAASVVVVAGLIALVVSS